VTPSFFPRLIHSPQQGNTNCQDEGVELLANSLQYYRKLKVIIPSTASHPHLPISCQTLDLSSNNITEVGFSLFVTSLSQYTSLTTLSLANNQLSDKSIKPLIDMIQNLTSLHSLSVDYNGFSPMALLALINSITLLSSAFRKPFQLLSLCGNNMNTESSKALGNLITSPNGMSLTSLHLDHMNIEPSGEQQIAASIASNQHCQLVTLTGILLGPLMTALGSPTELANMSNGEVLRYVREMWASYSHQSNSHTSTSEQKCSPGERVRVDDYPDTEEDEVDDESKTPPPHDQQRCPRQQYDDKQSIGRKRAASVGRDEQAAGGSGYPTRTNSEDDLADLADDLQVHICNGSGYESNSQNGHTKNREATIAETSEDSSVNISTEQIRSLIKKLEQIFDVILLLTALTHSLLLLDPLAHLD
jgi:hypothetical protein